MKTILFSVCVWLVITACVIFGGLFKGYAMEKAIENVYEETHRSGKEETCPLLNVCRYA